MLLKELLASALGINWTGWAIASWLKTEKFYDITGSATFTYVTLKTLGSASFRLSWRQKLQGACVLAWTARLGSFLLYRVLKAGKDRRFDRLKTSPWKFFLPWTLQGIWVMASLYPSMRLWSKPETVAEQAFGWRDAVGFGIWTMAFITEAVADYQKQSFYSNPENKNKWIDTGLWSVVRHPNYSAEITMWFALFLTSSSSFHSPYDYLTILGPIFNALLITKISGIPMIQARGQKLWGHQPEYQRYLQQTKRLIPGVW